MLAMSLTGKSAFFDSGGELIELRQLAIRVVNTLNSKSEISSQEVTDQAADTYYSKSDDYEKLFASHVNSYPLTLDQQIQITAEGILQLKSGRK